MSRATRHGRFEGVEIHHHQIDGAAAELRELRAVLFGVTHEDPAVDPWVQGLHATPHDLGRLGVLGDVHDGNVRFTQSARGPASGEDLDAVARELLPEFHHSGLVEDRDQRPLHHVASKRGHPPPGRSSRSERVGSL